jgi:hypothetical protein
MQLLNRQKDPFLDCICSKSQQLTNSEGILRDSDHSKVIMLDQQVTMGNPTDRLLVSKNGTSTRGRQTKLMALS